MTLNFTVPTGGADLCSMALQPGSGIEGDWGPSILCFRALFLFTIPEVTTPVYYPQADPI